MKIKTFENKNTISVLIDIVIIIFLWSASIAVVNPLGDFPLNDDWSFAQIVKRLIEVGDYSPTGWVNMSLATNVFWGALFCFPAGFSFDALRISTLTMSLMGIISVYWLAKELGLPRLFRVVAALTLAFNPIYYALSTTFMTDVPFTTLQTLSALFFLRCLKDDSNWNLCTGIALAVAATLSRQLGLAIPLVFVIAYLFRFGLSSRNLWRGGSPLVISIGALALLQQWLSATGRLSALYTQQNDTFLSVLQNPRLLLLSEAINGYVVLLYFGLFLLPSLLLLLLPMWQEHARRNINIWLSVVFIGGITSAFVLYVGEPVLPMLGNTLNISGIGPLTLRDTYILVSSYLPVLPHDFWVLMTWLGIFGAVLIIAALMLFVKKIPADLRSGKATFEGVSSLFLLLSAIAYLFPILATSVMDRYLIPVIPLLTLGIMTLFVKANFFHGRFLQYAGLTFVLAFSFFSICGTRDYLTWNRTRWQALRDLTQVERISNKDIDGGFEFNAWHFYDPEYVRDPSKSWWWVQGDTYLITFQSVLGYATVKEYTYSHWLPPYQGKIMVLKKADF